VSKLRKGSAIALLAVSTVGAAEGLRTHAYRDSIGVATVCYGETKGVRMGDVHTKAECDAMFVTRLNEFANHVEQCMRGPIPDKAEVAAVSLAYNIGWAGFCNSSIVRLWNAGARTTACDAFMKFNRAGGRVLSGLTTRRERERKLCLEGVRQG
jgi:lysozyme